VSRWFRHIYGSGPLHLIGHLAGFGVAAFAFDQIFSGGHVEQLLEWYLGFALLHDLAFVPLYTLLDRLALHTTTRRSTRSIPLVNHIRVPALISGLLLLIYAPLISRVGDHTYFAYSGHHVHGYLRNWVIISAVLFAGSGLVYAARAWSLKRAGGR
jgi:hypothetical protein